MKKRVIEVKFDDAEMDFLLNCLPKMGESNSLEWLPDLNWSYVNRLMELDRFGNKFGDDLSSNAPGRFRDWYNELTPETVKLPMEWKSLDNEPF